LRVGDTDISLIRQRLPLLFEAASAFAPAGL